MTNRITLTSNSKMAVNTSKDVGHIAKFDGTNFPSWKYGIWMFLEKNRLTSIVDGSVAKPVEASKVFFERQNPYTHANLLS